MKPFVSARVAEIQDTIRTDQIRYIKSNHNPTDALTRVTKVNHLMNWSEGLSFLELPEEKWPNFQDHTQVNAYVDADLERKTFQKEKKAGKHHNASTEVCPEQNQPEYEENPILLHLWKRVLRIPRIAELLPSSVLLLTTLGSQGPFQFWNGSMPRPIFCFFSVATVRKNCRTVSDSLSHAKPFCC